MAMDELEISKIFGAGCAALLAFVGFGQLGSAVVSVDQLDEPAYVIEVAESDGASGEVEAMPIGQLMAMADVEHGEKVYKKCASCHKVEDGASGGTGPNLWNVVGRDIAAVDDYGYSDALMDKDGPWDFAALDGFLEKPKTWAPGTKMGFVGLSKPKDRASVIAWLNEQSSAPLAMPAVEEAPAEEKADVTASEAVVETVAAVGMKDEEANTPVVVVNIDEAVKEDPEPNAEESQTEEVAMADPVVEEEEPAEEKVAAEAEVPSAGGGFDPAVVALMASADMDKGAKVFRKCKACHKAEKDGANGIGPNLYGIVGRDIASVDGFDYSDALSGKGGVWDVAALDGFLLKPKDWAKGTKMAFAGLRKEADRASIIAWLNEQSDQPIALPE